MLRLLVFVCGIALALGCGIGCNTSPREDTVRGQVFIVTQGRENVKLGLVTVVLYSNSTVRQHIVLKQGEAEPKRRALELQMAAVEKSIAEAQGRVMASIHSSDVAEKRHDQAFQRQMDAGALTQGWDENGRQSDAAWNESFAHLGRAKQWEAEAAKRRATLTTLKAEYEAWDSGSYLLEGLPEPLTRTQTDANGEFTIQVPRKGTYALAAHADRTVFGSSEEYTWIVQIPDATRQGEKLLLSNETLTTEGSPLSLAHTSR